MSTSLTFCIDNVKNSDYNRYLCCLLSSAKIRDQLFTIYAFNAEIAKIKDLVTEPMAGHIRLQWWRDAIEEIYNGKPVKHRHEICDALYELVCDTDIVKEKFVSLIDAREADIEFTVPQDIAALKEYAIATSSNLFELLLSTAGIDDDKAKEAAQHAGIAYAYIGIMRSMRNNAYRRRVMMPQDLLDKHEISADDIIEGRNLEAAKPIVHILCDKVEVNMQHVRVLAKDLPKPALDILLPLSIVELYLKKIRKNDYDLFHGQLDVAPLSLQWRLLVGKVMGV